jgi:hypothetical protein
MMAYDNLPPKIRILMQDGQPYANIYKANRIEWSDDDLTRFKHFWKCDLMKALVTGSLSRNVAAQLVRVVDSLG